MVRKTPNNLINDITKPEQIKTLCNRHCNWR
jgi:hypothetical protein